MRKTFLSIAFAAAFLGLCAAPASAAKEPQLPFELSAPKNVNMVDLEGNDSENTIEIHYSQNNSMSEWSSRKTSDYEAVIAELNNMGYDDIWITSQIDWSIDSQEDWHCNEYWLTGGYDKDYVQHLGDWAYIQCAYSEEISMSEWIFRWMGNIADPEDTFWNGRHMDSDDYDGWKDVLKEGQYKVIKNEDESHAKIDLSEHTIYARVRWCVTVRSMDDLTDIAVPSDWSEVAAIGKDAVKVEKLKEGDVSAPMISDLRYTEEDFNGYPVIAFKLAVDDVLSSQIAQVSGTQGGISIEVEARLQGTEEWVELQGDWIVKAGEMTSALLALAQKEKDVKEGTPIELRARYRCAQPEQDDFWSPYSEILTFASQDMSVREESAAQEQNVTETPTEVEKDKCKLCGFCPQPLGICIFIWLLILVIIIVVVVIVVSKKKKTDDKGGKQ